MRIGCVLAMALAASGPAFAGEGVFEINQTCAAATGCFAGDAPGLPVEITQSGSYRLTSNLTLSASESGILLSASDVSIDLAGFAIEGPNACTGGFTVPINCTLPPGLAFGIRTISAPRPNNVRVHGGSIRGISDAAIDLSGDHTRIEDVTIRESYAVRAGNFARIARVHVLLTPIGVSAGDSSLVTESEFELSGAGVAAGANAVILENRFVANLGVGLDIKDNAVVRNNVIVRNNVGIEHFTFQYSASGAMISGNTISQNRSHGVDLTHGTLEGNQIEANAGCGTRFATVPGRAAALANNAFIGNNTGGSCSGGGGQNQIQGYSFATSCNVVTCTTGTLQLGTFCPPNTVSCQP